MALTLRDRIRQVLENWFLIEPLLFSASTTHAWVVNPHIQTMRVAEGRIEYNPHFLSALTAHDLEQVMRFEALRIVLKHPYLRRKEDGQRAYLASNITLQEYLQTDLPFPNARTYFGTSDYDRQYFEFYYQQLASKVSIVPYPGNTAESGKPDFELTHSSAFNQALPQPTSSPVSAEDADLEATPSNETSVTKNLLETYWDAGQENTAQWDLNDLWQERINNYVKAARDNNRWGSIGGKLRAHILATLQPKLDYRRILQRFRAHILAQRRLLTRMKPNRRYGWDYAGSRRAFTTRLLFAVDVSGSISDEDLQRGFSIVNQFFKYGIEQIDVMQFDTEIKGSPVRFKKVKCRIEVVGRGGTCFQPILDYLDTDMGSSYDGLIIFTDGIAAIPKPPKNRHTRILWLFNHERYYLHRARGLEQIGSLAYLKNDPYVS